MIATCAAVGWLFWMGPGLLPGPHVCAAARQPPPTLSLRAAMVGRSDAVRDGRSAAAFEAGERLRQCGEALSCAANNLPSFYSSKQVR